MSNVNKIMEMFNRMSPTEKENVFFQMISFNLKDFDFIVDEICDNGLLKKDATEEDYKKVCEFTDEEKRAIIERAIQIHSNDYHINEYVTDVADEIRNSIILLINNKGK